jgi:hypothetical protein
VDVDGPRGVFVFTRDGDLEVFESLTAAGDSMESIDVRDGEYPDIFTLTDEVVQASVGSRPRRCSDLR